MNDLIRRALLGDREAQEECTRQGIVLPCPCCGGVARLSVFLGNPVVTCTGCSMCTAPVAGGTKGEALADWNTRHAPPIGRCETCRYWIKTTCYCWKSKIFGQSCRRDEYCSSWVPREEEDYETD